MYRWIKNIEEVDIPDLIALSEGNLGKGYLTLSYFREVIDSKKYSSWKVKNESNHIIAFLVAYQTNPNEVLRKIGDTEIVKKISTPMYCLDTMVVASNYKRKGIGKRLIGEAICELGEDSHYIMYTWKQGEKINMRGIAEFFQFQVLSDYKAYWEKECDKGLFQCPARTDDKCTCSMSLYYR